MSVSINTKGIIEKVFDSFKRITPALMAISVLTGLLLFLPESILEKMSLNDLPELWKRIIGIAFLLSIALIFTIEAISVFSKMRRAILQKTNKREMRKKIASLSPQQKGIVNALLQSDDKSIRLNKNSGDTIYLLNYKIIHMPQQAFTLGCNNEIVLTYVPEPWVVDLYYKEPELFE